MTLPQRDKLPHQGGEKVAASGEEGGESGEDVVEDDDGHARDRVKAVRRYNQDGPGSLLLVSEGGFGSVTR